MYTVVLMASLTAAPDMPDFHRHRRHGCCSPTYSTSYGCSGVSYNCCGPVSYGCTGPVMYGCTGTVVTQGGTTGTGTGGTGTEGTGATTELTPAEMARFTELTKGWEAGPRDQMLGNLRKLDAAGRQDVFATIEKANREEKEKMKDKDKDKDKGEGGGMEVRRPAAAQLIVNLPADARLKLNGQTMALTSSRRHFQTPPLQPGLNYYFDVLAEVDHNGVTLVSTQRVIVRSGEQTEAVFSFPQRDPITSVVQR